MFTTLVARPHFVPGQEFHCLLIGGARHRLIRASVSFFRFVYTDHPMVPRVCRHPHTYLKRIQSMPQSLALLINFESTSQIVILIITLGRCSIQGFTSVLVPNFSTLKG